MTVALAVLLTCGCASIEAPRGGPEDRDPPEVLEVQPDSAAVAVPLDGPLRFSFSEPMNRSSVQDWLQVAPWPGRLEWRWEDGRVEVVPEDGWARGETYTVLLGTQAADRRRNGLEKPFKSVFTTADSLPTGRVTGWVRARSLPAAQQLVALFRWPVDRVAPGDSAFRPPDVRTALRLSESDSEGRFELAHIPRKGRYLAGALHDESGNRSYDPDRDLWAFYPDPLAGDALKPDSLEIYLVYPDEPGDLRGIAIDSACVGYRPPARLRAAADSLERILSGESDAQGFATTGDTLDAFTLSEAEAESVRVNLERMRVRVLEAQADSARCSAIVWVSAVSVTDTAQVFETRTVGEFQLADVPVGTYRVSAYRDLDSDNRIGPREPAGSFPLPVELLPGRTVTGLEILLQSAAVDSAGAPGDAGGDSGEGAGSAPPDSLEPGSPDGSDAQMPDDEGTPDAETERPDSGEGTPDTETERPDTGEGTPGNGAESPDGVERS